MFSFFIAFCKANSVDPDQTPRVAAFELDLHCLRNAPTGYPVSKVLIKNVISIV